MERIQELLGRLADLSDAEVAELEGLILTEFDAAESEEPTTESVERMVGLADALDNVHGEVERRAEVAQVLAEKAKEAASRVRGGDNAETAVKDAEEDEEPEAEPSVAEDIEEIADDVAEVEEDVAVAEEDEEERRRREGLSVDSELSDESPAEAEASAEVEAPAEAELSADSEESAPSEDEATTLSEDSDTNPQEDAVTASVETGQGVVVTPPADAAPVPTAGPSNALSVTITAGGDIPGYAAGAELPDMNKVADAFAKRLHSLSRVQNGTFQQTIATLAFDFPEDRQLHGDDPGNITRVNKVISPAALTAAAGICAPLETIYDVEVCGDADRPVRDALARFNADRGGVKIYGSPTLAAGVTGVWSPETHPAKTCGDADCPQAEDVGLEAVYACLKFSNYTNRFFPEVVKANTDLAMINHARQAELNLLKQIKAASTDIDFSDPKKAMLAPSPAGVTRSVLVAVDNSAAYLRRKHRLATTAPMRVIFPSWLGDAMAADLALQMPSSGDGLDAMNVAFSRVEGLFRNRGINIAWSLDSWDDSAASTGATAADGGFDDTVWFPLFPEGTFLFLDGGTLDLGVTRDATMLSANEYATFVETFEGVAKTGCESLWVGTPVCVSGAAAALVETACSTAPAGP